MENKITTKYGPGVYEVEYLPADSNVYTTFQMLHEGHRLWSLRNGSFYMQFANRLDCLIFIGTVTRNGKYGYLFQD